MTASAQAPQTGTATGVVYDELGDPVLGASLFVVGTTQEDSTKFDGDLIMRLKSQLKIGIWREISNFVFVSGNIY